MEPELRGLIIFGIMGLLASNIIVWTILADLRNYTRAMDRDLKDVEKSVSDIKIKYNSFPL